MTALIVVPSRDYATFALPDGFAWACWDELGDADARRARLVVIGYGPEAGDVRELDRFPHAAAVQLPTLGYDFLPPVRDDLIVCNAAGVTEGAVAETCLLLMLAALRRYDHFAAQRRAREWSAAYRERSTAWHDTVRSLVGKRVAVLGFGGVGRAIAQRLVAFEAAVEPYARTGRVESGLRVRPLAELPSRLPGYDVVAIALPGGDATSRLVDAPFLAAMKAGALLVNVGRGGVVDTDALIQALRGGRIAAGLDVVDPEPLPADSALFDCPNLVLLPHSGACSDATRPRYLALVERQVRTFVAGDELANRVL